MPSPKSLVICGDMEGSNSFRDDEWVGEEETGRFEMRDRPKGYADKIDHLNPYSLINDTAWCHLFQHLVPYNVLRMPSRVSKGQTESRGTNLRTPCIQINDNLQRRTSGPPDAWWSLLEKCFEVYASAASIILRIAPFSTTRTRFVSSYWFLTTTMKRTRSPIRWGRSVSTLARSRYTSRSELRRGTPISSLI